MNKSRRFDGFARIAFINTIPLDEMVGKEVCGNNKFYPKTRNILQKFIKSSKTSAILYNDEKFYVKGVT